MKRQLSLVLALIMILGTFTTVLAADPVETGKDAAQFLANNKVLVGDEKGDLMLDKNLLRQDTVVLVAKLMGEYDVAEDFPTGKDIPTYEDVRDPFYLPLLAWAQANETFVGQTETKFGFGEDLKALEYAKVLLVSLGHTVGPNGDKDVKYSEALKVAGDLGILANVDVEAEDALNRGEMALMTFNALGVKMKDSDKTLAEKLGIEMPMATELTAKVNNTVNLKEVVLELSNAKLVDAEKLMDKNNYRVEKFKVEKVTLEGNNVILLLDNSLVKNRTYELTVRGIDKAIDKAYTFKALDNESPVVEKITSLGEYGIKVTFSEPIDDPQERNFLIDGKNVAMNVETYGRNIILTPYYNTSFSLDSKTLTIKEVQDFAGFKTALKDFELEIVKDDVAPKVTDVTVDGKVVTVTFDKDIYEKSVDAYENARDTGNIFYRSGRLDIFTAEKGAKKVDTNKVEYTFEENLPRRTEVTIVDVQNHSKVTMEKTTMLAREVKNNLEPIIVDFDVEKDVLAGKVTIEIEFDKDIDVKSMDKIQKSFDKNNNFKLYTEKVLTRYEAKHGKIVSLDYATGKKDTIILVINDLKVNNDKKEFDYILEVRNFEDESGNRMYTDYIEFDLSDEKVLEVKDIIVKELKDETEISIVFNRSVDRTRAEDKTNYLFRKNSATDPKVYDVANLDGTVTVENDGKTVTLLLPKFKGKGYDYLELTKSIRDKDGNRLQGKVDYELNNVKEYFEIQAATAAVVKAENSKKQIDLDEAQVLVTKLDNVTVKNNLNNRLGTLQGIIDAEAQAAAELAVVEAAVVAAETLKTPARVQFAQGLLNPLPSTDAKTALQARLNAVVEAAVIIAETTKTTANVATAQALLDELPAGAVATALQARLDVVTAEIAATAAVVTAETTKTDATRSTAQSLVTALPVGATKTALQARINAIVTQEDVDTAAAAVGTTFAATGSVNTVVMPAVPVGYTIEVNTTSAPTIYSATGEVLVTGSSNVVYTLTNTDSSLTADTASVTVTVTVTP